MNVTNYWVRGLFGLCGLVLAHQVQAAGFYISEIGTPGSLGTGGASNTTNTVGADSSWTNPAGMTGLKRDTLVSGFQLVVPEVKFDSSVAEAGGGDGGNAGNIAAIPSFFYVRKLSDRSRFGLSVVAPLGGGMNFGDNFVGRFAATKVTLQGVSIAPSFGYKVNDRLSLGAGVSILYTEFEQSIAINLPGPVADGKVKIENATDWGYQPFLSLNYKFSDDLLLGILYRAEADVDLEGDLNFRNMPGGFAPPANKIDVGWDNPQLLEVGVRYRYRDDLYLVARAGWQEWSQFSENRLEVSGGTLNPGVTLDRNFKDTWNLAVGLVRKKGDHAYSTGIAYDSSPVDDEDRTIDLPFDEQFKLSAAYAWTGREKLDFSVGATLVYAGEGKVDQTAQGVRFKGEFDKNYILFLGSTVRYQF